MSPALSALVWIYPWTAAMWWWIVLFVIAYGWYTLRVWRAARLLQQPGRGWLYKCLLRAVVWGLLIVALLGPSLHTEKQEIDVQSKDIFFCVDVSASMDATDVLPSRIEKVKLALKDLAKALTGNRMGVIIFASEAYIQCPLTHDISALGLFIDAIGTSLVSGGGTNFAAALRLGGEKLQQAAGQHQRPTAQVLVLISDGENFGTDTQVALAELRKITPHFFTMGIGTEAGSQIPTSRGPRKDRQGQPIHTQLRAKDLQNMGGQYFEINARSNQQPQLLAALKEIKGTLSVQQSSVGSANMYRYLLFVALFLCILDILLPVTLFRL